MALTREQKKKIINDLKEKIVRQKAIIFVGITGLKVKDLSELRRKLKAVEGNLQVAKKTLIEKAFKENNLEFDKNKYREEVALAFGFEDEIKLAKRVYEFSLVNERLKILGGFFENRFREAQELITLAQLPTREELLARLVGTLSAPLTNLASALQYNLKGLIYLLTKIKA